MFKFYIFGDSQSKNYQCLVMQKISYKLDSYQLMEFMMNIYALVYNDLS